VTSKQKIAANQNNAKRSTGPRTARGKLEVRRNATRHALAASTTQAPTLALQVERMAKAICRGDDSALKLSQARDIAESQVLLTRSRAARFAIMQSLVKIVGSSEEGTTQLHEMKLNLDLHPADPQTEGETDKRDNAGGMVRKILTEMTKYDRYERRASSRRQRAIRTLVATSILGTPPPNTNPLRGARVKLKSHKREPPITPLIRRPPL
jgi:hypothetical protein